MVEAIRDQWLILAGIVTAGTLIGWLVWPRLRDCTRRVLGSGHVDRAARSRGR